jgi:alanyl-tRNA synthetase
MPIRRDRGGTIKVGDAVLLAVDVVRRDATRANHSATHLLHQALRNRLGAHVTQRARWSRRIACVSTSRTPPRSPDDIAAIEAEVNAEIRANEPVTTPDDARRCHCRRRHGAVRRKYGDEVRVLSMGRATDKAYSVELCGGTHVRALGDIGVFRIVGESAVSSGVRRIEALTGEGARQWLIGREEALKHTASLLRTTPDEVEGASRR